MKILFENIVKESQILSEGRKEDVRERYPNLPQEVFEIFVNQDPSGNHKYLMAIAKMWHEENSDWGYRYGNVSDAKDFMENVTYFHNQTQKFDKKDINQYNSMNEFKRAVADAKTNLSKGEIKKSAKKIYEDGRHLVVQPLTHAASCFYGAGTRWCTTSKNQPRYYLNYTSSGTLFYYINKGNGKKRAFYTPFSEPFLRPESVRGDSHSALGRTQIYTETDNLGRSLRGIPVGARQAMDAEHKKGLQKYLDSLPKEEEIKYRLQYGMDLPEDFTVYNGNWRFNSGPPRQLKKIVGNYRENGYGFGSLEEITGDVELHYYSSIVDFGNLKIIGGDLKISSGWSWNRVNTRLESIGSLRKVGGTFPWNLLPSLPLEEVNKLKEVGKITMSPTQMTSITQDVRLPGLPNTKVSV